MTDRNNSRTGAQLIVECLRLNGIDTVFTVPGESFLATLDAFYDARDSIRLVVCRQEGGAAFMAEAYGRLTGKPGVLFVTKAVGACNAAGGVETAHYGGSPMILCIGHVDRDSNERQSYQEVDFRRMFGQLAKWVGQVDDAARVPEYMSRAVHIATSGKPGPVVLALGEDMQSELTDALPGAPATPARAAPDAASLAELRDRLAAAKKPLAIVGGGGWTTAACEDFRAFAEANGLPVATGFRRQDLFDNRSPSFIGMAGIRMASHVAQAMRDADLLLIVGQQINDKLTRDFALIKTPKPDQDLIHVLPEPGDLGHNCRADLAIAATLPEFCAALRTLAPIAPPPWRAYTPALRGALDKFRVIAPPETGVDLAKVLEFINQRLPDDAIVCSAVGASSHWVSRCLEHRRYPSLLGPSTGTMGYSVPATVAAKIVHPDRLVVGFMGDCDFMMASQEFATAVAHDAAAIFVIFNNHMFGSQRMHQEGEFPGRTIGSVEIANPDFPALAQAYGAFGERVTATEAFPEAFERAVAAAKPAIIEIDLDPTQLSYVSPP